MTANMVTNKPKKIHSPEKGSRCTDVLSDTLVGYAGIQKAEFSMEAGALKLDFDPRILTREQALRLVQASGQRAVARVEQCRNRGAEACAFCAGQMGEELTLHYQRAAALPAQLPSTIFQAADGNGSMTIDLKMPAVLSSESAQVEEIFHAPKDVPERRELTRGKIEIVLTALTVVFGLAAFFVSQSGAALFTSSALYLVAYTAGGYYGLLDGIAALREKRLDVNLLMILAAVGAAFINQPAEGATLLFLFSLSNTLQSFAMGRSRKAIEKLLDLRPPMATVRRGSRLTTLAVEKLVLGDVVIVRPGERFPIDGDILSGESGCQPGQHHG